jgi:hypothetical protein
MKKLLLAAVLIALFTLNGVDQVQLVAVIAFSAGVYVTRFLANESQQHLCSPSAWFTR